MPNLRFLGCIDFWHKCGRCGLIERPAFRIVDTITNHENRVCEPCFRALLRLNPGDTGLL